MLWAFALLFALPSTQAVAQVPQLMQKGAIPIPGTSQTREYLTLQEKGVLLQNDEARLKWTADGNLQLTFCDKTTIWESSTGGSGNMLRFLATDGTFEILNASGARIWSAKATGGTQVKLDLNRNLILTSGSGQVLWQSNTAIAELKTDALTTVHSPGKEVIDFLVPDDVSAEYLYLRAEGGDGGYRHIQDGNTTRFKVAGGAGATIEATFAIGTGDNEIPPGSTVRMIIGTKGYHRATQTEAGCPGGAGTAVMLKRRGEAEWRILVVAGGGSGAFSDCCTKIKTGNSAEVVEEGGHGSGPSSSAGGKNGQDGSSPGGEWVPRSPGSGAFGEGPGNGWPGGDTDPTTLPTGSNWNGSGWGFGGGGRAGTIGGGGGGYSGGGSPGSYSTGGGGGSHVNGALRVEERRTKNSPTLNTQDGFIQYEFRADPQLSNVFRLAANPQKCVDLNNTNTSNGSNLQLWDCKDTDAQRWTIDNARGIHLQKNYRKCLDVNGDNYTNGTNIQLWDCNGTYAQNWIYDAVNQVIRNGYHLRKCLSLAGTSNNPSSGTNVHIWDCKEDNVRQQWLVDGAALVDQPRGVKTIRPEAATGLCMNLEEASPAAGNNVRLWTCSNPGTQWQNWTFDFDGRIHLAAHPDKCLGVLYDTNNVHIWNCQDDNFRQVWIYDGFTRSIRWGDDRSKCLDIDNANFDKRTNVQVYDCNLSKAQRFVIESD